MDEFKIDRDFLESELFREVVLKSEIDAFLHDIDKMSEDFLLEKAFNKKKEKASTEEEIYKHTELYKIPTILKKIFSFEQEGQKCNFLTAFFSQDSDIEKIPIASQSNRENSKQNDKEKIILELPDITLQTFKKNTTNIEKTLLLNYNSSFLGETAYSHHDSLESSASLISWLINSRYTACDGIDTYYDKASNDQQKREHTYIANAFGYEFFCLSHFFSTIEDKRKKFLGKLANSLKEKKWHNMRETLFQEAGRENRDGYFRMALGETRRSANDVVLFDHVFSVAALLKTMLVRVILESNLCQKYQRKYYLPVEKGKNQEGLVAHSSWDIFSIALNITDFLYRTRKIGEIKGFYDKWENVCKNLRETLESKMPVATELYRDLHGIHFLIPRFDIPGLEAEAKKLKEDFYSLLQEKTIEIVKQSNYFSCKTQICETDVPDEKQSNLLRLGPAVEWAKKAFLVPFQSDSLPAWIEKNDSSQISEEICYCCHQRVQNRYKLGYCDICYDLRQKRLENWYQKGQKYTIWLNELSDGNSQVALISIQFDLSSWLNGNEIKSFFTGKDKVFKYPSMARIRRVWSCTQIFFEEITQHLQSSLFSWPIEKRVEKKEKKIPFYRVSFKAKTKESLKGDTIGKWRRQKGDIEFYFHSVENKEKEYEFISITNLSNLFPIDISKESLEKELKKMSYNGQFSLELGEEGETRKAQDEFIQLSDLVVSEYIPFVDIVTTPQLFQFLCPAEKVDQVLRYIYNKYTHEMSKVRDRLPFHANVVYFKNKYPLYVVLETAQSMLSQEYLRSDKLKESWEIFDKEEKEEKKVKDQQESSDFYSLEHGQKFSRGTKVYILKLKSPLGTELEWKVDSMTGDPDIPDLFYPNFEFEAAAEQESQRVNLTEFVHPDDKNRHYINVQELRKGDKIKVRPSTWDVVFVDSNESRFMVQGEKRHHAMIQEGRKAYYLDDIQIFQKVWDIFNSCSGYSQTQLEKLQSILLQKRLEWKDEWLKPKSKDTIDYFIGSLLLHPNQLQKYFGKDEKKHKDYALMHHVCYTGMIFDIIAYYCKLCGKKIGDENQNSSIE